MAAVYKAQLTTLCEDSPDVKADIDAFFEEPFTGRYSQDYIGLDNVIRVRLPIGVPYNLDENYFKAQENLNQWHTWVQGKACELIAKKQKANELPVDRERPDFKIKIGNYGARVFDTILKTRSPWFSVFNRERKTLQVDSKFELRETILLGVLANITNSINDAAKITEVLDFITDAINFDIEEISTDRTIWIMLECYFYDRFSHEITPHIRVISFDTGAELRRYRTNKSQFEEVSLKIDYYQTDMGFRQRTWDEAQNEINASIEKMQYGTIGRDLYLQADSA
ncbi:hypothetical protein BDV41DRAFT_575561 [Aspergillus transmontanensis]|uniref:Uncharacterized protein n=1 Tax=Aspergillus transmontanensis TaxID=1034304 RepID=A0A5N6W183_9EURO|nr:hypothetical protein BDV41DRAFT_575561 [Aspergillus transmontanensis]